MINSFSIELDFKETSEATNIICQNFSIELDLQSLRIINNTICDGFSIELGDPNPSKVIFLRK